MVAWPAAGKAKEHNFKQFDVHRSGTITKCPQVFCVTRASLAEDTASETEPPADEGASQNNDDEEPVPNYVSQLEVGMRSTFVRHHLTSLFGCTCLFLIHYGYPCRHMIAVCYTSTSVSVSNYHAASCTFSGGRTRKGMLASTAFTHTPCPSHPPLLHSFKSHSMSLHLPLASSIAGRSPPPSAAASATLRLPRRTSEPVFRSADARA